MCREVFKKFKACVNADGVNAHRANRDAIKIVYKSLQKDREQADNYGEDEVQNRADDVYRHVYRVYPTLSSPYYETGAAA